jgi:large subunit ribosomal protein L1
MVGRENMTDEQVAQNIEVILTNLIGATKRGLGNVKSIYLKTTMGEAVKLY